MLATRVAAATLLLALMGGCDNDPDPNFQNALDARAAAQAGDPYNDLDNGDRRWGLSNYANQNPAKRVSYAQSTSGNLQGSYAGLLSKLDSDQKVRGNKSLFTLCRPKFEAVLDLAKADSLSPADRSSRAERAFAGLAQCRDQAISAEENGDADAARVLKRFSSFGMVLIGASTVAKGDRAVGERLWNKSSKLADADMPGFQVKLDNFR